MSDSSAVLVRLLANHFIGELIGKLTYNYILTTDIVNLPN